MADKKKFRNPGEEISLKEILEAIREIMETKAVFVSEGKNLDQWMSLLNERINVKLGRTRIG